jgi:hypothetical protein
MNNSRQGMKHIEDWLCQIGYNVSGLGIEIKVRV